MSLLWMPCPGTSRDSTEPSPAQQSLFWYGTRPAAPGHTAVIWRDAHDVLHITRFPEPPT